MKNTGQQHTNRGRTLRLVGQLSALICALGMVQTSQAATATGLMTVTATVAATCVVGTSTLAFVTATSAAIAAGNVDAIGTVSVNCTSGSAYTVALSAGAGTGATVASRKMTAGAGATAQLLPYTVYTTAARTTVWGDGSTASATVAGIGSGVSQSIAAYGRIFQSPLVQAATYTDTLNVTVTY
jgi:spore coat protein U-like protein